MTLDEAVVIALEKEKKAIKMWPDETDVAVLNCNVLNYMAMFVFPKLVCEIIDWDRPTFDEYELIRKTGGQEAIFQVKKRLAFDKMFPKLVDAVSEKTSLVFSTH